jgi:cell division control protein 24
VEGVAVAKRVTNRINEAQRIAENRQIVKALEARIEDWKGHHIVNFGHLLLQDFFNVTKSDVDREYHVFLFQKIILCCKEDPRATLPPSKKVSKSNSLLKKQAPNPAAASGNFGAAAARNSNVPLLLKGRIFLNNVIEAVPVGKGGELPSRQLSAGTSHQSTPQFPMTCECLGREMTIQNISHSVAGTTNRC